MTFIPDDREHDPLFPPPPAPLFETANYRVVVAQIPEKNRVGYVVVNKQTTVQETYAFIMADAFIMAAMLQKTLDDKPWEPLAEQKDAGFTPPPLIFQ